MVSTLLKFIFAFTFFHEVLSSTMLKCYQDDCLRAFQHTSLIAASFCSGYTATAATPTHISTPGFVISSCTSQTLTPIATRLSTACACLSAEMATTTSKSLPLSTSTSTSTSSSRTTSSSNPTSTPNTNIIQDAGFESSGSSPWNFIANAVIDSTVSHSGQNSAKLSPVVPGGGAIFNQDFDPSPFTAGQTLYFSIAIKTYSPSQDKCNLLAGSQSYWFLTLSTITSFDWTIFSGSYAYNARDSELIFLSNCLSNGDGTQMHIWVDDIYLGTSPPTLPSPTIPSTPRSGNLAQNPGFESVDLSMWHPDGSPVLESTVVYDGVNSLQFSGSGGRLFQYADYSALSIGQTIYYSAVVKYDLNTSLLGGPSCTFVLWTDSGTVLEMDQMSPFDWTTLSGSYPVRNAGENFYVVFNCNGNTADSLWIDDIYLGPTPPS